MSDIYSTYCSIIKQAGPIWDATVRGTGNAVGYAANATNPGACDLEDTLGYRISRALTEWLSPKAYNPDNTGQFNEYTEFLKDTEEGDQYLREAAKLRRRARILLKQMAEAEEEKNRAARSRYF